MNYPELPSEYCDLALGLLFAQTPLNRVQAIICGQCDVSSANRRTNRACKDVRFCVETDSHPVSVHHSEGTIVAELVAVPHLVCRGEKCKTTEHKRKGKSVQHSKQDVKLCFISIMVLVNLKNEESLCKILIPSLRTTCFTNIMHVFLFLCQRLCYAQKSCKRTSAIF